MRCRRLKEDNNIKNVVWFGSYGLNQDGTAKFYNANDKHDNYADEQAGVADALTQRLSVIRTELWHDITFGLPLLDKVKTKVIMDAAVAEIVLSNYNVVEIIEMTSKIVQHDYSAKIKVQSTYGVVTVNI